MSSSSLSNGWRLNQPKVTLLASAFFLEWSLPTYSSQPAQKDGSSKTSTSASVVTTTPFLPPPESVHFTCEWKAASSLDSTKLEFKGDTTSCLVPIEWAEEDVVMRLSFRFSDPIPLPDGTRAPTTTIFDGERCIVKARRAPPMPLLMPIFSSASNNNNKNTDKNQPQSNSSSSNPMSGITCAQILKAHPGLVDAYSLALLRKSNDVSQLECGPWLGSMKMLMDELGVDDSAEAMIAGCSPSPANRRGAATTNNNNNVPFDDFQQQTAAAFSSRMASHKLPTLRKRYQGCGVLNGIKLDVWEVTYKRTKKNSIDFSFFTNEHENAVSPRANNSKNNNNNNDKSSRNQTASPTFNNNTGGGTGSPQSALFKNNTTTPTDVAFHEDISAPSGPASPVLSFNESGNSPLPRKTENLNNKETGDISNDDDDDDNGEGETTNNEVRKLNLNETIKGNNNQSDDDDEVENEEAQFSISNNNSNNQKNINSNNNFNHEDVIIFLSAHDGLDEVNMFENRKLTDRLNPINITKALIEEWLIRPNLLVCVCGAFSFGQFAVLATEQLFRECESKKAKEIEQSLHSQHQFTKPRIVCVTFASNPPRLSQADSNGRLKKKDNVVIRSQNNFLHIAPIIEAPILAPDDLPNVEAAANARRSRALEFVDYFLGECASFAVGPNFLSIVLESYLERQNCYDAHSILMTAQGTAEVVNPILSVASAVGATTGTTQNELALAAACESPWIRGVVDETATSSGFTPLDVVANLPELVRERSLMQKGLPDNLTSVLSSVSLLSAFESTLQAHLVAAACQEALADAALRCEPVVTNAEIKPTRLKFAELSLVIQGTNLQFARHVILRDSSTPRDAVFARTEIEVPIRERTRGFDGFTCKIHPASLLRFVEEEEEEEEENANNISTKSNASTSTAVNGKNNNNNNNNNIHSNGSNPNMFDSSEESFDSAPSPNAGKKSDVATQPPSTDFSSNSITTNVSPLSRTKTKKTHRLVCRFDVCIWAENGCAAFVDVVASLPDPLIPWMHNSGSWISKQNNFLSPPVELVSSAARLHLWGSFASSMHLGGTAPLPGTDLPRRLLKSLESASVSLATVNPQQASSNFFSRALKSAKDKLANDPLTIQNAPSVPANLKLAGTEALLKDIPAPPATQSVAAATSRARILHQQSTETRELKKYLDPLLQNMPWLNNGVDYRTKVLRAAQLLAIPLENAWYQHLNSANAGSDTTAAFPNSNNFAKKINSITGTHSANMNATVPVVEAVLWHHVVSLLTAVGTKIQDSITEVTLKSFCETIGMILLRHEHFAGKKESDGPAFFAEMMQIWVVCVMHELRSFASGTTLVIVTGDRGAGSSSVTSLLQNACPQLRNFSVPHSFTWVVDLFPLPDLFGEALLLFPNVALFFVTTLEECSKENSDVLNLTATTNSLILAQRADLDSSNWNRHHQWIVLNKIDAVPFFAPVTSSGSVAEAKHGGTSALSKRIAFVKEEFGKKCSTSLKSWSAYDDKNLLPVSVNPMVQTGVSVQEVAELRLQATEVLKAAVQRISQW